MLTPGEDNPAFAASSTHLSVLSAAGAGAAGVLPRRGSAGAGVGSRRPSAASAASGRSRRVSHYDFLQADVNTEQVHKYVYETQVESDDDTMTMEALPDESNYRDLRNLQEGMKSRPTIEELRSGQLAQAQEEPDETAPETKPKPKGKIVKFGWVKGVFVKCVLNIWGVMLFLRLTTVIGQCGIVQGLLVVTLANVVTAITAVSMSAVATNGIIQAGGIYYMISRSLGPEFGGAIGVMFTIANSIAVATYLIGFCNSLLDCLEQYIDNFDGIVGDSTHRNNDIRIIATGVLICILGLVIVGLDWVTRVDIGLLLLLLLAQADVLVGSFMPREDEKKYGFIGYSSELISKNLLGTNFHDYGKPNNDPGFFYWFGVYFPAVTGIVAGANLSGDLKDPAGAIPKGTLLAVGITYVAYFGFGLITGCVYLSEASGIEEEYWAAITGNNATLHFDDCKNPERFLQGKPCKYGSSNDQQTMTRMSYTGYLVYAGCFAATLSSAIASLVGGPRVLQAVAKDKLYPILNFFAKGRGPNNDPVRGYFLVFVISLGCTMIAELDIVGTLLSNFFVAAYALINLSVFHASVSKSPGWRPSFKYYNKWVSLFGTFICVAVMFLLDWITALVTFFCIGVLFLYILYMNPEANWGSSAQAQQFISTLKSLQNLQEYSVEHVKNYRPKILVLSGIPAHRVPLVDFAYLLTKNISFLICAHVSKELQISFFKNLRENVYMWLKDHNIKGFFSVTSSQNFEDGAISLMNIAGLGRLNPNMVLMGFKSNWQEDANEAEQYYNVINHAIDLHLAVGILRLTNCDYSNIISVEETIMAPVVHKSKKYNKETADVEGDNNKIKKPKKPKKSKKQTTRTIVYKGVDGRPLPKRTIAELRQFRSAVERDGTVDIWWLYDDGGLTLLLPYILRTRAQFKNCHFRVFSLSNNKDELDKETRNLATLLAKFRINFSDVTIIPDVKEQASKETKSEFTEMMKKSAAKVPDAEILANQKKINRHLRLTELLRAHSTGAEMIIMTLPMPRRGLVSAQMYLGWLDIMTRNMPPFLLIRGNQTSVLTFYS